MREGNLWRSSCNDNVLNVGSMEDERELINSDDQLDCSVRGEIEENGKRLVRTLENGGGLLRRLVDQDLQHSDHKREIISDTNDVKVPGNQVGSEQSREQRQSDGTARLERLPDADTFGEVERPEILGEVKGLETFGEIERLETFGDVERKYLRSWLEEFSAHSHLPRAYQVDLELFLQNNSAGEPVQS